jgi:hypothetical protein
MKSGSLTGVLPWPGEGAGRQSITAKTNTAATRERKDRWLCVIVFSLLEALKN